MRKSNQRVSMPPFARNFETFILVWWGLPNLVAACILFKLIPVEVFFPLFIVVGGMTLGGCYIWWSRAAKEIEPPVDDPER